MPTLAAEGTWSRALRQVPAPPSKCGMGSTSLNNSSSSSGSGRAALLCVCSELSSPVSILQLAALQRNRVPEELAETTTRARTKALLVPFRSSTRTSASIWCTGATGQRNICSLLCPWDQSRALSCCRVHTPSALKSLT